METQDTLSIGLDTKNQNNENSSSQELLKREKIKETPFVHVRMGDEKMGFIALGQYKLTEELVSLKEAESITGGEDWKFMIAVIGAITNQTVLVYLNEINKGKEQKNG